MRTQKEFDAVVNRVVETVKGSVPNDVHVVVLVTDPKSRLVGMTSSFNDASLLTQLLTSAIEKLKGVMS